MNLNFPHWLLEVNQQPQARSVFYFTGQNTRNDDDDTGEESREKKQHKRKKMINQKKRKNPKINTTLWNASCSEPRALKIIRE